MSSFDKLAKMYEKMREEKPGFNEKSVINQPEPSVVGDNVMSEIDRDGSPTRKTTAEEEKEYNEDLKRRILEAAKSKGKKISSNPSNHIYNTSSISKNNLEKRIEYLEEAVKLLMDQQMRIIRENG